MFLVSPPMTATEPMPLIFSSCFLTMVSDRFLRSLRFWGPWTAAIMKGITTLGSNFIRMGRLASAGRFSSTGSILSLTSWAA